MQNVVLYHGRCTDGWVAAWAAWRMFGDNAEYIPVRHDDGEPPDVRGRNVYILDFCYPRQVLLDLKEQASSVTVLDHHKTNRERCEGLSFCQFDMSRSGAGIAWDYFHGAESRPKLVSYVEDRDIWRWALPRSREISSTLLSYELENFEAWSELATRLETDFDSFLAEGNAINRMDQNNINTCKHHTVLMDLFGYKDVPVVNALGVNISELLNQLAAPDFFSVSWHYTHDKRFKYSLRSKGEFDVAKLAERFNGGGHRNAAAFTSDSPPWLLGR